MAKIPVVTIICDACGAPGEEGDTRPEGLYIDKAMFRDVNQSVTFWRVFICRTCMVSYGVTAVLRDVQTLNTAPTRTRKNPNLNPKDTP